MLNQRWAKVVTISHIQCVSSHRDHCLWNKTWTSSIEVSVCQVRVMSTLSTKHHSISRPKLELHVNRRHPTSALCSSRLQSHSHACSLDDVSDTHEWPIDVKNVMRGGWVTESIGTAMTRPPTLLNPYTTAASDWPGPDMIQRTSARWGIGP